MVANLRFSVIKFTMEFYLQMLEFHLVKGINAMHNHVRKCTHASSPRMPSGRVSGGAIGTDDGTIADAVA